MSAEQLPVSDDFHFEQCQTRLYELTQKAALAALTVAERRELELLTKFLNDVRAAPAKAA
jgi:hypothetical protein